MKAIPIKIPEEELDKIDYLIKIGKFKNRSDALRNFISKSLEKEEILTTSDEIDEAKIQKLLDFVFLQGKKEDLITFTSAKSATDLVAEGRER